MTKVKALRLGNGSVTYIPVVEPRPASSRTTKTDHNVSVTINDAAIPGTPAHYEVTFMIGADLEHGELESHNTFHLSCVVPEQSDTAQYRSVEDQAARQLAPMLRALADKIEADLPNFVGNRQNDS